MSELAARYQSVCQQIKQLTHAKPPQLLAVSKTQSAASIRKLYDLGQRAFGENYLQESLEKIAQLQDLAIEWHFIGHIQRNKTKAIAEHFDWVHGVDRLIIAERLAQQRSAALAPLNVCIQVNIDGQATKAGCQPEEVPHLVQQMSQLSQIRLRGLMIIPRPDHDEAFVTCHELFEWVKPLHQQPEDWDTLSMGMSGDMAPAIAAGSTLVRVGTAIFGTRTKQH